MASATKPASPWRGPPHLWRQRPWWRRRAMDILQIMQMLATHSSVGSPRLDPDDLGLRSARAQIAALREGRVTSEVLLEAYLARIERLDPTLGVMVYLDAEGARRQAREADAARARGDGEGALLGLPMTVKDVYDTADMPTTMGLPWLKDHRPSDDATLVARLRAAGAVILGKTSCPLASYDWQSVHPHRGRAHNPYNLNRTPGGSSGGSAAALAARLTPPELGSDAAGSIRVPCHFSGVVGLRPTEGTLSVQGHARQPGAPHVPMQLVTAGPMARSVADLRLAYDVLARMTPGELGSWPTGESAPAQAEELRIGWAEGLPELMPDAATREVLRQARIRLEEAGITVVDRPVSFDSFELLALWGRLSGYDLRGASPWYGRLFPGNLGTLAILCARLGLNAMTRGLARGLTRSAHGHRLDLEARAAFVAAMDRFLEPVDAWVFPAGPMAAFTHRRPGARIEVDEQRLSYAVPLGLYQCPLSVAATPVVAVPAGLDAAGLPVGVQLVGRRFSDRRLLAVAEALENAFGTLPAPAMADRG